MIANNEEEEEDNDPGSFSQMVIFVSFLNRSYSMKWVSCIE